MRETLKHEGTLPETDQRKQKAGIDEVTGNNLEKDTTMNLKDIKREPVEMTETDAALEDVKELNITAEEADVIGDLNKLNIKGEEDEDSRERGSGADKLQKRGPTGGIPVNDVFAPMEHKHIPVGPPLHSNYANPQMYQQQQPNYAAQHGRRMLEEADQPPRKFIAPSSFNQPQVCQMPQYNMNNLNQINMPPVFNPSMTYQPTEVFGIPPQQEKISLRMKNNTSGGTVTVTSPDIPLSDPFSNIAQNQNLADNLLDDWDAQNLPPTQNLGMLQLNQIMATNINEAQPLGHPITQPQMPVSSQTPGSVPIPVASNMAGFNSYAQEFTGQSFTQCRRRSDPNDSGMESAGEASPYPESTPSPNGSTYTSPPSVDSGCGRSPKYEPFSPDSNSQGSVGGSPPKYTGMVTSPGMYSDASSPGSGNHGSPGTPQVPTPMSAKSITPGPDNMPFQDGNKNEQSSKYIDEHLEDLHDSLAVIADNIRDDAKRMNNKKLGETQSNRPISSGNISFQTSRQSSGQIPALANAPPTSMVHSGPPATTTVTTIILPPQQPLVAPQQQQQVVTNPVVLFPVVPQGQSSAPIIIVPPKGAQNTQPPPKRVPRKILPKMPTSVTNGAQNGTNSSPNPTSMAIPSPAQAAIKPTKTQPQQNREAIKQQQQKMLNMARRNVAAVKTENLKQIDEEGDTYLHIAVCRTDKFMIQALLERLKREGLSSLVDQENNKRQTPLFLAVAVNDPEKVQLLVNAGANVNTLAQNLSADGQTTEVRAAIHVAAVSGKESLRTLEELLKGDVNINIVNNGGLTALHCAIVAHGKPKKINGEVTAATDSRPIIQALIKKGADPSAQDKKSGKTPLMYAIEHRSIALVETILIAVEPSKMRNVVKTQAFDGSSCLKIAEGIKKDFNDFEFNRLWDILQGAVSGNISRIQPQVF